MAIAEISSLISGIKGTIDITKGLKSAYDANTIFQAQTDILERLFAIQSEALSLQEKHSTLIDEKRELENRIKEFENWSESEIQYSLRKLTGGVFVIEPNKSHKSPKPKHWLCTNCYGNKKKSILQPARTTHDFFFECLECKNKIMVYSEDFQDFMNPDYDFETFD